MSGCNVLYDFQKQQQSFVYLKKKDSQIAKEIGQRLGVNIRTTGSTEPVHEYMCQENEYDIVFLMSRAEALGYELFVEPSKSGRPSLYFGPSEKVKDVAYELEYRGSEQPEGDAVERERDPGAGGAGAKGGGESVGDGGGSGGSLEGGEGKPDQEGEDR